VGGANLVPEDVEYLGNDEAVGGRRSYVPLLEARIEGTIHHTNGDPR
jgi:hypothetical protein